MDEDAEVDALMARLQANLFAVLKKTPLIPNSAAGRIAIERLRQDAIASIRKDPEVLSAEPSPTDPLGIIVKTKPPPAVLVKFTWTGDPPVKAKPTVALAWPADAPYPPPR